MIIFIPNLTPPDVTERLLQINPSLAREARKVLDMNKSERHFISMDRTEKCKAEEDCTGNVQMLPLFE